MNNNIYCEVFNCGSVELIQYIYASIFILIFSSSVLGKEGMECPDGENDPSKFCLPGQTWNEEIKECVNLV